MKTCFFILFTLFLSILVTACTFIENDSIMLTINAEAISPTLLKVYFCPDNIYLNEDLIDKVINISSEDPLTLTNCYYVNGSLQENTALFQLEQNELENNKSYVISALWLTFITDTFITDFTTYTASGYITEVFADYPDYIVYLPELTLLFYDQNQNLIEEISTDKYGHYLLENLSGNVEVIPVSEDYIFTPPSYHISEDEFIANFHAQPQIVERDCADLAFISWWITTKGAHQYSNDDDDSLEIITERKHIGFRFLPLEDNGYTTGIHLEDDGEVLFPQWEHQCPDEELCRPPLHFENDLIEILRNLKEHKQFVEDYYVNGEADGFSFEKGSEISIGCHDGELTISIVSWERVYDQDGQLIIDNYVKLFLKIPLDGSADRWSLEQRNINESSKKQSPNWST